MIVLRKAVLALLLLAACGDPEPSGADAEPAVFLEDAGTPVRVEIGTGVFRYEPLSDGEEVPIIKGPQGGGRNGGFHVWHATRVNGIDPRGLEINFTTLLADSRLLVASSTLTADLDYVDGAYQFLGAAPFLMDCCLVVGAELLMQVRILDKNGLGGSDARRVRTSGACVFGQPVIDVCE